MVDVPNQALRNKKAKICDLGFLVRFYHIIQMILAP